MPFCFIRSTAWRIVFTKIRTSRTSTVRFGFSAGDSSPMSWRRYVSVCATFSPRSTTSCSAAARRAGSSNRSSARACRSVRPASRICARSSGVKRSSRSLLATADWLRPSRSAASSCVTPHSSTSRRRPSASSKRFRSRRCRFSSSASTALCRASQPLTKHGIVFMPAMRQARSLLSPAISS